MNFVLYLISKWLYIILIFIIWTSLSELEIFIDSILINQNWQLSTYIAIVGYLQRYFIIKILLKNIKSKFELVVCEKGIFENFRRPF